MTLVWTYPAARRSGPCDRTLRSFNSYDGGRMSFLPVIRVTASELALCISLQQLKARFPEEQFPDQVLQHPRSEHEASMGR